MRDRIWNELIQAKFNSEFAGLYTEKQRVYLRCFNILIFLFSSGGVKIKSLDVRLRVAS